jgi:hypothetical protein
MLKFSQIDVAITDMLLSKFPTIEIQSSDVKEGFNRPSFFVTIDNVNRESSTKYSSIRSMTIRIYYFPTDRYNYSLEVLDIQQQLEELFDQNLTVETRVIPIQETNHFVVDKVLEFDIDIEYYEEPLPSTEPEPPTMANLEYDTDV